MTIYQVGGAVTRIHQSVTTIRIQPPRYDSSEYKAHRRLSGVGESDRKGCGAALPRAALAPPFSVPAAHIEQKYFILFNRSWGLWPPSRLFGLRGVPRPASRSPRAAARFMPLRPTKYPFCSIWAFRSGCRGGGAARCCALLCVLWGLRGPPVAPWGGSCPPTHPMDEPFLLRPGVHLPSLSVYHVMSSGF